MHKYIKLHSFNLLIWTYKTLHGTTFIPLHYKQYKYSSTSKKSLVNVFPYYFIRK